MQEKIEDYLKRTGFAEISNNIDPIKITYDDEQDLRYFFENERLGLHLSGENPNLEAQEILNHNEIGQYLEVLYISGSLLEEITIDSENFPKLKYINLSQNNALKTISLNNLSSLEELYTHHCHVLQEVHLTDKFDLLQKIDTSYCVLNKLILPVKLPKLWYFNFTKNHLDSSEFLSFVADKASQLNMEYLFWDDNPLPESFINTLERNEISVLKAFFIGNLVSIYRKKLILLGNTQAGKTSLCDILKNENLANGNSTHGVNVFRYTLKNDRIVQVYDFGGQDFYHNAHLSFYSTNAHYLLIYGNGQEDKYTSIPANGANRADDIFPMDYWLNSIAANLNLSSPVLQSTPTLNDTYQQSKIKLGLLENLEENQQPQWLNQKDLSNNFVATDFWHFQLRKVDGSPLNKRQKGKIKAEIDQWLLKDFRHDQLRNDILAWGDTLLEEKTNAIWEKTDFRNQRNKRLTEDELKLLHDSYAIFLCEKKGDKELPAILQEKVIVNLGLFAQWIYAILNLENLLGKGYFDIKDAEIWLKKAKFNPAIEHLDFIVAYLLYQKMIFQIEGSNEFLVPQYLPEPQYPADKLLLNLFKKPFVKYEFTGFYHTQLLTNIIAEFFKEVAKTRVGEQYRYLIWKNKVILYLVKKAEDKATQGTSQEETTANEIHPTKEEQPIKQAKQDDIKDKNPANFLLISFDIIDQQQPTLSLSVLDNKDLNERYDTIKTVVDFIDKTLEKDAIKHKKQLKAPNNHYIDAKLLGENNTDSKGNISDLIFDVQAKCFYRKGDFPLFVDPKKYPMKKIFISYSKFDEPYKNEFKSHLISLQRDNLIDTFDDRELELGEKWDSKLRQKIHECDFFVCLVSVKFLNVGYIENIELPEAFRNNKRLILIIIKPCDWQNFTITWIDENGNRTTEKLGDYNAFDKGNIIGLQKKYEETFDNPAPTTEIERDYQWLRVIQEIRDLLKK